MRSEETAAYQCVRTSCVPVSGRRPMSMQSALVRAILEQYRSYTWTVQGFGFIRTKIADVGRIHVWDSRLAVQLVSTMHTHPWPLRSTIISGELINQRFELSDDADGLPYLHSRLKTGEGGELIGEPASVRLACLAPELYVRGQVYQQAPDEIHRSIAQDGTVTLMERPQGPPLEEASVFWPDGTQWVSAEPRPAQEWETSQAIGYALARWAAA
jgi:hypothetical protein